tara:strand:+ start:54 stop:485 length:432 start_codon:yes stop_codon:yes gene_type:complete
MNKLFLTMLFALVTTIASAQFSVTTTVSEVEEENETTYNLTDKLGVLYQVNEKLVLGLTKDGEENYELLGRYAIHESGLWATCVYNYASDSEDELMDKMELGLGYSFNVWKKLYVEPYYVMPAREDDNGEREGKFNLSFSYKL